MYGTTGHDGSSGQEGASRGADARSMAAMCAVTVGRGERASSGGCVWSLALECLSPAATVLPPRGCQPT